MPADDVEKFLSEQKAIEDRRKALIEQLLKEKAEAIKSFDEKLAKLGHEPDSARSKRDHHGKTKTKQPAVQPSAVKPKEKE